MKTTLLSVVSLCLVSCAGVEGYRPQKMNSALRSMSEMQTNTRVFNATGWNPHL